MSLDYRLAVVGFIDLLGFSADLMSVESSPSHLGGRLIEFSATKRLIEDLGRERYNLIAPILWSSDSCVTYTFVQIPTDRTPTPDDVDKAVEIVSRIAGIVQCAFAISYHFSRGGIAIGPILEDAEGRPFGTGVVRAVEIEKQIVTAPRIYASGCLAGSALNLIVPENNRHMYVLDFPLPSLDYLSFAEVVSDWGDPRRVLASHAGRVHSFVEKAYSDPTLGLKAAHLLSYHNWHIRSRGGFENLLIPLDPPAGTEAETW